ncbi:MAG: ECF RNA polymerase sigma factor SigD [Dehalococcoidia bacterium]|nr:ECF RNA polymerase sigma factor SigD [Bacillota bacterium]MBT9159787.1 ECF RNA polymerase sigma factor SigD [Chloroflexota bacterium]MBT9162666.1 ECF RNA polymerase sigma factor SigD [Chloroflexota bacterium]MBT9163700.1 ECF RNA polymerase sigma factor SigD [Chloroflexota bacterium]
MQDEQNLVHRAQQGDQEALAQLYESHFDNIYRYVALRVGNRIEAEDITQEVFLKAVRSIHTFKWKGIPFSAWLFRIAKNEVIDSLRKRGRHPTVPLSELPAIAVSSAGNPCPVAEGELDIEQLTAAIRRLTQAQQEVISLRFSAELSIAEVASLMGKRQGAVKALQHSAILALRRVLSKGGDNEKG